MSLIHLFREIIRRNELGNCSSLEFSDPDGIRTGKSGWSFGACQFDTKNNPLALRCLIECGFTDAEIDGIVHQTCDVGPLEQKLQSNAHIIETWDCNQLQNCIDRATTFSYQYKIPVVDSAALLSLADTVNQYGSLGNGSASFCRKLSRPVTADDVLDMKLTWKYSQTEHGKKDTIRRYNNIIAVMADVPG
jgi:hypothetical protein